MNDDKGMYSLYDIRSWIRNGRLNHFSGDLFQDYWPKMTHFEKFCGLWTKVNSNALEHMKRVDALKIFKFEEILWKKGLMKP